MPGQFVPRGLMDRVQLADTPHGRGCQNMSDTDTTYATARPSAIGDLRFAGTIATGLVAGTLGLGALAAPLVGWKDWPAGLQKDAATQTVRLGRPRDPQTHGGGARPEPRRRRRARPARPQRRPARRRNPADGHRPPGWRRRRARRRWHLGADRR